MNLPEIVDISMGGGGKRMDLLIKFIGEKIGLGNSDEDIVGPTDMDDSAVIKMSSDRIVITTDGHTVDPVFFPGGNIGDLAIAGTVNDLMVMGCQPLYLTLSMIIEEGFPFEKLGEICSTMDNLARKSGVRIVAGDTKVMPKGSLNNIVLTTAGVGVIKRETPLQDSKGVPGDVVIVSGTIGDHGAALMARREGIDLETNLPSDVRPLWPDFKEVVLHPGVRSMKDVTRGGLASALSELSTKSGLVIEVIEDRIPVDPRSKAICDILGLEPLEISSEGKVVMLCSKSSAEEVLDLLKSTDAGKNAKIIGELIEGPPEVHVKTNVGGTRLLDKPYGEPIPRVC